MKAEKFFTFFAGVILAVSCQTTAIRGKIYQAESYLHSSPDSALVIMKAIDTDELSARGDKAYYALLMSAAMDKNYIDVTDDSLINIAVDYYSTRRDLEHRMMSYYYQGLVLYRREDFSRAIVALERAEKDAVSLVNHYYAGLIYRTKGEIYNLTHNNITAQESIKQAISEFRHLSDPIYAGYAELSLAICYLNCNDYANAEKQLESVRQYHIDRLDEYCSLYYAGLLVNNGGDLNEAIRLFQSIPRDMLGLHESGLYALALDRVGWKEQSDKCFSAAYSICHDKADSATIDFMRASALHSRSEDAKAYLLTRKASLVQDSVIRKALQQTVSNAQKDYFKSELALQEELTAQLRERNCLITILLLLIVILFVWAVFTYRKHEEYSVKDKMLQISFWQNELKESEQTNAALLGSLFCEKMNNLNMISEEYVLAETDREKYVAFNKFKDRIEGMRQNDDLFNSLELDLDKYCDGVMTKLKAQVPTIKGDNPQFRKLPNLSARLS